LPVCDKLRYENTKSTQSLPEIMKLKYRKKKQIHEKKYFIEKIYYSFVEVMEQCHVQTKLIG
jgi:hypothetical protein